MKKGLNLISVPLIIASVVFCEKKKDDKTKNLSLLALAALSNSTAAQYPNSVSGSAEAVKGAQGTTSGVSAATSAATSGAQSVAQSVLGAERANAIVKGLIASKALSTCDNTERSVTGTYTTASTVTASSSTAFFLTSGSYTVTPNITIKGTYSCAPSSSSSSSSSYNLSYSGSMTVAFSNATLKYFDIEDFVKNGKFTYKTVTLNGTVTTSNLSMTSVAKGSSQSTTSSTTSTYVSSADYSTTNSDSSKSSSMQVDGGTAVTFDLSSSGKSIMSMKTTSTLSGSTYSSCYNTLSVEAGSKTSGTYNGGAVSVSYNYTKADFEKMMTALGSTVTYCK